ncbi:hypothetical protein C7271_13415 [filamentous cyanobacterium CCP5]|nr:hypothetical protein C7271_13415 [filamentous cyanobacterium CCP5]
MRLEILLSGALLGGLLTSQGALGQTEPAAPAETAPSATTTAAPEGDPAGRGGLPYEEYMSLGYAAAQRGDYYEATRYFRGALYVNPDDRSAVVAYWNAYDALTTGQDASGSYDQLMNQGYDATEAGRYQAALERFQQALEIRPGDYYATQAIRNVRTYLNSDQAISTPTTATSPDGQPSLQPYQGEFPYNRYMRLGFAALQEEAFATAVDYFRSALYERPNDRRATIAYWNAVDGIQDGNAGLDENSDSAYDRYMRLGYDANQRGEYQTALSFFQQALELRPNDVYAQNAIRNVRIYISR